MTNFLDGLNSNFSNYNGLIQAGTLWQQSATADATRSAANATKDLRKDVAANTAVQKKVLAEMEEMTDLQRQTLQAQQQQIDMQQQKIETEQWEKTRTAEYRKLLAFTKHLMSEFDDGTD